MTGTLVERLRAQLVAGHDDARTRFGLGNALLGAGQAAEAATHLAAAVAQDPQFSAAWKLLGRAHAEAGQPADALAAWEQGLRVAEARGDVQAVKEMRVFLRRLEGQQ